MRRLEALEAQQRTHAQAVQTRWADILWGLIDAGEVEEEELLQILGFIESYWQGDRSPECVAALARWEALTEENPELGRGTSLLNVWEWWKAWADVWQRA